MPKLKRPKIKRPKIGKIGKLRIKDKRKAAIVAILVAVAFIVIIVIGGLLGLWAARPSEGYATCTVVDAGDDNDNISDEAKVTGYKVSIIDKTLKQLRSLDFDDYKLDFDKITADKVNIYMDENHLYYWKITYKGSERWVRPEVGENVILMVEETGSMIIYAEDENLNRTVLGSLEDDWTLRVAVDNKEGLMPGYDFKEDDMNLIWFDFNFSRAAQEGFVKIHDYYNEKQVDGTHLYIGVSGMVVENADFTLEFGSGKGDTYDCNSIDIAFGFYTTMDYMD